MRFLNDDRVVDTGANKRTMKVICAGLPRCATSSIQEAMESPVLGFGPCMHMAHIVPHVDRSQMVIDAIYEQDRERRHKLLHKLFDGYAATADFPGIMFIDDFMDMYPDAVVVLNQRQNGKVWSQSITTSLEWFGKSSYLALCYLWKMHRLHYRMHHAVYDTSAQKFGYKWDYSEKLYDAYNDWVRAEAKKRGRPVLEWKAGDGYEPLCKFLGKELPSEGTQFPHSNDAAAMKMLKRIIFVQGVVSWLALGATAWAGWRYGPELLAKATPIVQGFLSR
ncbi:hypothetical protein GQ53DRAFT_743981 [Thozetella sp. PMI_491]|nr:hypothetical protein GQ53DRAFT_743981 [Thozetella sp. PMI_491]